MVPMPQAVWGRTPPTSVVVATPLGWQVLDPGDFADAETTRSRIVAALDGQVERGDELAATFAELAVRAVGADILFAALSIPGVEHATDLTSVTLAVPERLPSNSDTRIVATADTDGTTTTGLSVETQPGPDQNAVMLPAGPAARIQLSHRLAIGSHASLPVFCVEYAVAVPRSKSVVILTFATIAPRDIDSLRAQFADIASTLAFA